MDKLSSLIDKIVSLETEKSRKISSFVGAIVGDAACIHLEWIYDETTLTEKLFQHSVGKGLKQEKDSNETTNVRISKSVLQFKICSHSCVLARSHKTYHFLFSSHSHLDEFFKIFGFVQNFLQIHRFDFE